MDVEVGGLVLWLQEPQEQRPGRQGLRVGAEYMGLRAVLQEQEKRPGRQGSRQVPSDWWIVG